ncbi:hypothetical protein [Actinosynnema sp. NPDC020468]|uniref:hypothetical protein n=1 Tax=Actinosynnema sp. NPDC020468 TaxID=3154488 RepID=UPI0033F7E4CC
MIFFACTDNPGDRAAVTGCAEGVLVVISSAEKGDGVEVELTTSQAREASQAVRGVVADHDAAEVSVHGALHIAPGAEDDTVYLAEDPTGTEVYAVVLRNPEALEFASALSAAASDSDMRRLNASLGPVRPRPLTAEQLERVAAVEAATRVLGTRRGRYVVEAALFILTGEVV